MTCSLDPSLVTHFLKTDYARRVNEERNEIYVFYNNSQVNFQEANSFCAQLGSLPVIRDENDQRFLQEWIKGESFWLGARYSPSAARIIWQEISGTQYSNWDNDQAACGSNCCALLMNSDAKWMAHPCSAKAKPLCRLKDELVRKARLIFNHGQNKVSGGFIFFVSLSLGAVMTRVVLGRIN